MERIATWLALACAAGAAAAAPAVAADAARAPTMAELLAGSGSGDWRTLDPENTLYLELPAGRVVIELAPHYAPLHAANIRALARAGFYDGLAVTRVQDNFVVQWGDAESRRRLGRAAHTLAPEFTRRAGPDAGFTPLAERDVYAPEVGFADGFPAARDARAGTTWLAHCYAMVGAGRDNAIDSGNGTELYVVIGQAPRQLDRNIALVGRVVEGMELLAALPRGTGPMGFYERPEQRLPIRALRVAADLPAAGRTGLEALRTDTPLFARFVESRRNRRDAWYQAPAGHIDLCNIPLPVRRRPTTTAPQPPH
ncbi:MAG: peptidylprolyl isomerase [Steroidobacteraceae bacterium]